MQSYQKLFEFNSLFDEWVAKLIKYKIDTDHWMYIYYDIYDMKNQRKTNTAPIHTIRTNIIYKL